ncbi:alanine dehydrogenase [Natronobacterium gregoryi]|uniref:Alanine dehydrogenase n=2 Tax=Natronobacterium gregoryi TaxID=44930 RepID=L0AIC8_NATGS|nr:alanine dehydrogenase [Natronobacterium gregoryi]AFZ72932.1 putative ornithine cyclodeaminase, mu-crystallin [Natronobacterium gregoryi SP2]ELY69920.1 ornithine cyclodeaminase [Natronobacterium gregoryi SP2]PLK21842.1 alanine dehydrogenase [Natronobacterium gregoryi SP2]SFI67722.1 L-alanine dehydrogenase [Natronobacterium gregoryi]
MNTLLLDSDDVDDNARMSAVVDAVEEAFGSFERGDCQMPAKSYIDLPQYNGDFRSMPAYLDTGEWDAAGLKWVNVHPDNPEKHDLPTVLGTMIYSDPVTAAPLAIMDGTALTMKRTGAAAAVATDYLAVEDATSMGIVGAGVQSYTQLEAISEIRSIEEVVVADKDDERTQQFIDAFDDQFDVRAGSISEAGHCDVVSTVTPVEEPIVGPEDVTEHTHINAMGADAEGKQELDDDLLLDATVVIDDHEQCTHSGEINVPYHEGILSDADIHAEIGELVVGDEPARTDDTGVTVFDSTGLAIQDVAAAHVVYEHALENDNGSPFGLIGADGV